MPTFKDNNANRFLTVGIVAVISMAAYFFYCRTMRMINYEVFPRVETTSWMESQKGIYRPDDRNDSDVAFLSKDEWKDFEMSFTVENPRNCGVIFNYKTDKDYYLIFFDTKKNSISYFRIHAGVPSPLARVMIPAQKIFSCSLRVSDGKVRWSEDNKTLFEFPLTLPHGKVGFLSKETLEPETFFRDITVKGHLERGEYVSTQKMGLEHLAGKLWIVVLFYFLLMGLSCVLAKACNAFPKQSSAGFEEKYINLFTAAVIHFLLTVFIFAPFVFHGDVFVSSTDNYGEILPFFLLSKHNFANILHGSSLGLWNPYNHNGVPFFSSHWNMIYYPLNWPIFLSSDQSVFVWLTLRMFIEVFLIGLCAYGFFWYELKSRSWALFCSIIYQMCSLLIFTFTVFPATSLFFAMTLYLYLLWSMPGRKAFLNYIFLTISVILILTSANVAFVFYALIGLSVVSVYRFISLKEEKIIKLRLFFLCTASAITGFMISAIRILPCAWGILDSNRVVQNYFTIHDRFFMLSRLFVPEIGGDHTFDIIKSPNLNFIYDNAVIAANTHNTFFVYFGVLAALLLVASLFVRVKDDAYRFWKIYTWICLAIGLLWQPLWGLFSILLFPLNHHIYLIILLPMGLCMLAGYTGKYLLENKVSLKRNARWFLIFLGFVQSLVLVVLTYLFPSWTIFSRTILILSMAWIFLLIVLKPSFKSRQILLCAARFAFLGLCWILVFWSTTVFLVRPAAGKELPGLGLILPFMFSMAVILTALYLYADFTKGRDINLKRSGLLPYGVVMIGVVAAIFLMSSPCFLYFLNLPVFKKDFFLGLMWDEAGFLLMAGIAVITLMLYKVKKFNRHVLMALWIFLAICDLAAFNIRFNNIVAPHPERTAFFKKHFFYQDIRGDLSSKMDLTDYRCDFLNKLGLGKNTNIVFGIPSYTGTLGYMPKRFSKFISSFGYADDAIMIYPGDAPREQRLWDYSAVRYIVNNKGGITERVSALSRLRLFYSHRVIPDDDELLKTLKDPSFDFKKTVLLSRDPGSFLENNEDRLSEFVPILTVSTDEVAAHFTAEGPATLLFCESYSPDWKAYLDGRQVPLYAANYNFMACPVTMGYHTIIFKFEPPLFVTAMKISAAGLLVFTAGLLFLSFRKKEKVG